MTPKLFQRNPNVDSTQPQWIVSALGLMVLCVAWMFGATCARAKLVTKTTLSIPGNAIYGLFQASDGNFYSSTGENNQACTDSAKTLCSFIYKITPDGTISTFHAFQEAPGANAPVGTPYSANTDGIGPSSFFEGSDGNFYGTCYIGGQYGMGTIFKIAPDGTFTLLYTFEADANGSPLTGYQPQSMVQGADGNLYGVTGPSAPGGVLNGGTFFQASTTGNFAVLHTFPVTTLYGNISTAPEDSDPTSIVQGADGNFYITMLGYSGEKMAGGLITNFTDYGAIDQVSPSGNVVVFYSFAADGSQGNMGYGLLVEDSQGNLYGTTTTNTTPEIDSVFEVSSSGSFTLLHQFTGGANGGILRNGLFVGSDGNIYGTTTHGGNTTSTNCATKIPGCGTYFQLQPSGTLTTLYSFTGGYAPSGLSGVDGALPQLPIVQSQGGVFYGTSIGNRSSLGTIYSLALTNPLPSPIQLSFSLKGQTVTSVPSNTVVTLNWSVLNAFSETMQQCHASVVGHPVGSGVWIGSQTGTLLGNAYTGSATITPTAGGNYTYVLDCGGVEIGTTTLSVSGVTIVTTGLPNGMVSTSYTSGVQALGGVLPYQWGYIGSFPLGLVIDPVTGFVAGSPTQFGKYQVTIAVRDSSNPVQLGTQTFTLTIASGLMLAASLNNAVVGKAYNQTAGATGGLPPYKWAVTSGALPNGLTLNATTGVITGTPTAVGNYTFAITVSDSEGTPATVTQSYGISTAVPPMVITEGSFPDCTVNVPCTDQFEVTGGKPPYTWAIQPGYKFPAGLTLASDGTFSGTPTQYSTGGSVGYPDVFWVQVTDSESPPVTVTGTNEIDIVSGLKIAPITLPVATEGVAYQAPAPVGTGGLPPYKWVITAPSAPQLTQDFGATAAGVLYSPGPLEAGTFTITYLLQDSEGIPATTTLNTTLTIVAPSITSVTTLTTSNSVAGTGMGVTLTAKVTATVGVPVGAVTFYSGSTSLGTVTLDATGSASLSTSFSTPGVYTLTASYSGGGAIVGSVSAPVTETVVTPGISASVSLGTLTMASGGSGMLTITLTPTGGYTGSVSLSCGTLPPHVSCTFAPPSLNIPAGSGAVTDTLMISTADPTVVSISKPKDFEKGPGVVAASVFWPVAFLSGFFGLFGRKRSRFSTRLLLLFAFACSGLVLAGGLSGCGGGSNTTPRGTYTIGVNITLANGTSQSVNASVIVN